MSCAHRFLIQSALLLVPTLAAAQSLDRADILKALGVSGDWPTYSGDYSGKRYSLLTEIDRSNAGTLTEAWKTRLVTGTKDTKPEGSPIVGGIGRFEAGALANIKGSILDVNGILYVSAPDNAWALDARDGHEIRHFVWKTRGGTHIGTRGVGMWHDRIYMETPDDVLLCLQARTGAEIWHKDIADFDLHYFSTTAPIIVGNHVLVGTGNDFDEPGFLQSFDPETGRRQWKFYVTPMKEGDPGLETWGDLDAARHGGGNPWMRGHTIRRRIFTTSGRATRRPLIRREREVRGTTCIRVRSWRSMWRRARWLGITRHRPRYS